MKHNIINSIFAISLLLSAAVGFQSCSNDNEPGDKPGLEDKESDLTLYYGVPYKLPFSTAGMTVIIGGGGVSYKDGVLYPNVVGICELKLYKGGRENLVKTINIKVVPNYDVDKLIKHIEDFAENPNMKYYDTYKLIDIPDLPKDENVFDYLSKRGLNLKVESGSLEFDPDCGSIRGSYLGNFSIKITMDDGCFLNFRKQIDINVEHNYELTMTSGDTKPLSDFVGDSRIGIPSSSNNHLARIKDWVIYALVSSSTPGYIYASNKAIKLTVKPYDYPDLFPKRFDTNMSMSGMTIDEVKNIAMSEFTLVAEKKETINNENFTVLTYAPFYNCKSISIYIGPLINTMGNELTIVRFKQIETGKPSEDVFKWLLSSGFPTFTNSRDPEIESIYWYYYNFDISPIDGSWSNLRVK